MGIIRPRKRKKDPDIAKDAIMIMPENVLRYALKRIDVLDVGQIDGCLYRLYLTKNNKAICGPFLGAPQAVMGLERLIICGAINIWVFSWCGAIVDKISIGDVVLPIKAFSDEGTSRHYMEWEEAEASLAMTIYLKKRLIQKGISFHEGSIWTTDAPYRETPEKVEKFRRKGAIAVDMEMSALMTVAKFRGVNLAGIFVVSDEIRSDKWRPGFSSPLLMESSKTVLDLLMELLLVCD